MSERLPLSVLPERDWSSAARSLEEDGVVFLPGALGTAALKRIAEEFAHSVAHPSPKAVNFYLEENATFFEDTGQRMGPLVRETGIDAMVEALWGEGDMWYLGEQLFLKEGGHS